jgi:hypothetical protein
VHQPIAVRPDKNTKARDLALSQGAARRLMAEHPIGQVGEPLRAMMPRIKKKHMVDKSMNCPAWSCAAAHAVLPHRSATTFVARVQGDWAQLHE